MKKKVALLLTLCVGAAAFAGCTSLPPSAHGIPVVNQEGATILRSWRRDVGDMQKFTDKYFLNYDYDDPYNE